MHAIQFLFQNSFGSKDVYNSVFCELRQVLFLALSVTFLVVYEISPELLNGFAPNSQGTEGKRVWSLARTSLSVKVKGQRSRSPRTKQHFSALLVVCLWFVW